MTFVIKFFIILGEHDAVTCYHCSGSIANWAKGDDPWEYHAHCYPTCTYVYLKRGKNFIDLQRNGVHSVGPYQPPRQAAEGEMRFECKVCMMNELEVVFKPCEHLVACSECTFKLQTCLFCKKMIKDVVKCVIPS